MPTEDIDFKMKKVKGSKTFCKRLEMALEDEKKAPIDYDGLKRLTKDPKARKTISSISAQEKTHFKRLSVIKREMC